MKTKEPQLRVLPQNRAAEAAVIGSMMIDHRCVGEVCSVLQEGDFAHEEHKTIFNTIRAMYENDPNGIDGLTVRASLEQSHKLDGIGGLDYLKRVMETVPSSANAMYYARIVKAASRRRSLIAMAQGVAEAAYDESRDVDEALCEAESKLFLAAEQRGQGDCRSIGDLMVDVYNNISNRQGAHVTGIPSGFYELDDMTSGFHEGELIVIAARPSMGKTAVALNIACHVGMVERQPVVVFSMEMGRHALAERVACSEAQVDSSLVRTGMLDQDGFAKLVTAHQRLQDAPIYIDDCSVLTPFDLRSRARRYHHEYKVKLIVIDYLQLMSSGKNAENRQQEITLISRHLKALARELNVPVIVLSQLNRGPEARENHRPRMSDLRESGSIEQDADLVMLLYREDYYHKDEPEYVPTNIADVIVGKQRNGPTGTIHLLFRDKLTRFENLAQVESTPF